MKKLLIVSMLFCVGSTFGMSHLRNLPKRLKAKVLVRAMTTQADPAIYVRHIDGDCICISVKRGDKQIGLAVLEESEIETFWISQKEQRKGYGTKLLAAAIQENAKWRRTNLFFKTLNAKYPLPEKQYPFFKKHGFIEGNEVFFHPKQPSK